MNYLDYREALGICFNDEGKQKLFINRMQVYLQSHPTSIFNDEQEIGFCYAIGAICELNNDPYALADLQWDKPKGFQRVWLYLAEKQNNFKDFLAALIVFANSYSGNAITKKSVIAVIKRGLKDSNIQFDIFKDKDGIFIFPKGAKELDDKLVTEPLQWLTEYPNARIAWNNALKAYADATDENASDCADLFRKAIEQFFREFFGGKKSLENYKSGYGNFMESHGIPAELSNSFEKVLNQYTTYMNNYAKHGNGTSKIALEYIMYQTGSLIRFLITLKQEEK